MTIEFYALSGSPFTWKVWLALEHKGLAYDLQILSADGGDLKQPRFLAINPRGKVPVIVDKGFVVRESHVIVDYLDEAYRDHGEILWPRELGARTCARLIAAEVDAYVYPLVRRLVVELRDRDPDVAVVMEVQSALAREMGLVAGSFKGDFAAGADPSAADFALYPLAALVSRLSARFPQFELDGASPSALRAWMQHIEGLPYFQKTYPPHWAQEGRVV